MHTLTIEAEAPAGTALEAACQTLLSLNPQQIGRSLSGAYAFMNPPFLEKDTLTAYARGRAVNRRQLSGRGCDYTGAATGETLWDNRCRLHLPVKDDWNSGNFASDGSLLPEAELSRPIAVFLRQPEGRP